MILRNAVNESCVAVARDLTDKQDALRRIAAMAAGTKILSEYLEREIYEALADRERIGSTGFENGVARPHCLLENADGFVVGFLISPGGVDFGSVDGGPTHVMAFIVGSRHERNRHIQLLSSVSRLLADGTVASQLRTAESGSEAWDVLITAVDRIEHKQLPGTDAKKNLFVIIVQREEYFDEILQTLSAVVDGSLTVIESANAGSYLHRMPLFASYWTDSPSRFNRMIVAAVDQGFSNDLIRRINTVVDLSAERPGVLVTMHEAAYAAGKIDF